jgi:hypothetical protein
MFIILGSDGKEYGPITPAIVRDWFAAGRIDGNTQMRGEGSSRWMRIAESPQFGDLCSTRSPRGAPAPAVRSQFYSVDPEAVAADLIVRAPKLDVFTTVEKSWELLKGNFWPLVAATAAALIAQSLLNLIPFIGFIFGALLSTVFTAGLYLQYLKLMRGYRPQLGEVFSGFSIAFIPLMLGGLVSSMLTVFGMILLILPGIYLAVAWIFTSMLIIDRKYDFWPAMEISRRVVTAQWWRIFVLLILAGIIGSLGVIVLFVGVFFTIPIFFGSVAVAYETLFNPSGGNRG